VVINPGDFVVQYSVSLPSQPQMNGGKERTENLNASYFCLAGNMGLPVAGLPIKDGRPVWQRSPHGTQGACCNGMGSQKDIGRQ
jgi:hypothetical protein